MAISSVNNTYHPFLITERSKQVNNAEKNKVPDTSLENSIVRTVPLTPAQTNTNNEVMNTNQRETTRVETYTNLLQRNQTEVGNYINNVQKIPNGMDAIAQVLAQSNKGVNRLA